MDMRKLIDLVEAPIADLQLDTDFDQGTSFSDVDKKLLQSPKGQAKIIRAFSNTPFVFKVIFRSHDGFDANSNDNEKVDDYADLNGSGIYEPADLNMQVDPHQITVLMLGNLSPVSAKMPMNGWTLAHKIGHSIQDHLLFRSEGWKNAWGDQVRKINYILHQISSDSDEPKNKYTSDYPAAKEIKHYLSMKSARDDKLETDFETFAEVVAQYLIKGRVTPREFYNKEGDPMIPRFKALNHELDVLFNMLVGKVLVEV